MHAMQRVVLFGAGTLFGLCQRDSASLCSSGVTLVELRDRSREFAAQRNWEQFHTPRNLALAMVGEVGELCECFQWKGEVKPGLEGWSEKEKVHLGEEMSDVLLYLVRLADRCDIDLGAAVVRKMDRNAEKYPASLVHGSSKKYTEYKENVGN
eukprot:g1190.t1